MPGVQLVTMRHMIFSPAAQTVGAPVATTAAAPVTTPAFFRNSLLFIVLFPPKSVKIGLQGNFKN